MLEWDDDAIENDNTESPPLSMKLDRKESNDAKSSEKEGELARRRSIVDHLTTNSRLVIRREKLEIARSIGHHGATVKVCGLFENFDGRTVDVGNGFRSGRWSTSIPAVRVAGTGSGRP